MADDLPQPPLLRQLSGKASRASMSCEEVPWFAIEAAWPQCGTSGLGAASTQCFCPGMLYYPPNSPLLAYHIPASLTQSALSHLHSLSQLPHTVKLCGFSRHASEPRHCLLYACPECGTLADYDDGVLLPWHDLLPVLHGIALALCALHSAGGAHGKLRSAACGVRADGTAWLLPPHLTSPTPDTPETPCASELAEQMASDVANFGRLLGKLALADRLGPPPPPPALPTTLLPRSRSNSLETAAAVPAVSAMELSDDEDVPEVALAPLPPPAQLSPSRSASLEAAAAVPAEPVLASSGSEDEDAADAASPATAWPLSVAAVLLEVAGACERCECGMTVVAARLAQAQAQAQHLRTSGAASRASRRWQKLHLTIRAADAFAAAAAASLAPCVVCAEAVRPSECVSCESHGHRLCADCLDGFVGSLIGTTELRDRFGGLPCVAVDGTHAPAQLHLRPTALARAAVQPLLRGDTLRRYLEALLPPEAGAPQDLSGALIEALNYSCPSCHAIVDPDPEGCIAMRCSHCRAGFCWVCFKDCGGDAHEHCRSQHGSYFPARAFVRAAHRRHRWLQIDALLQTAGLPRESARRAAALEADPRLRAALGDADVQLWPFPSAAPSAGGLHDAVATSILAHVHAAQFGDLEGVQAAVEADPAQIDAVDDRHMTALMGAAHGGHVNIVAYLLRRGARTDLRDDHGVSALDYAVRESHHAVAVALLRSLYDGEKEPNERFWNLFPPAGVAGGADTLIECFCWANHNRHNDVMRLLDAHQRTHLSRGLSRGQVLGGDAAPA